MKMESRLIMIPKAILVMRKIRNVLSRIAEARVIDIQSLVGRAF